MESKCLSFAKDSITKLMVVSLKKKKIKSLLDITDSSCLIVSLANKINNHFVK